MHRRPNPTISCALALLIACIGVTAPASAHQLGANYESVIDRVSPQVAGLTITVPAGQDELKYVNRTGKRLVIFGYEREPYVRIEANGGVYENQRSPAKYLNADTFADVQVPESASAKASPDWRKIASNGTFAAHDHRIHWMSPKPPSNVAEVESRRKIFNWDVPFAVGGDRGSVTGTLYWLGASKASPLASAAVFVACFVVVVVCGVVWYRRSSSRGSSDRSRAEAEKEAW